MEFYSIETGYSQAKRNKNINMNVSGWESFYKDSDNILLTKKDIPFDIRRTLYLINSIEKRWYFYKKAYYQIWPGVIDAFLKTRLDIKCGLIKFPHKCFAIKLPEIDIPILTFKKEDGRKGFIQSIIVYCGEAIIGETGETKQVISATVQYKSEKDIMSGNMILNIDLSDNTKNIEDCINTECAYSADQYSNYTISPILQEALYRLIIAVLFLSTGSHKILEYDVLSKHLAAYRALEANSPKRKEYEAKAKREGKNGWNIGYGRSERGLKLPAGVTYEEALRQAGNRELLYQHTRGGHWHTVKIGEGRKDFKVVWYEETTVRPDLPPAPLKD